MAATAAPSPSSRWHPAPDTSAQAGSWAMRYDRTLAMSALALADLIILFATSSLSFAAFSGWIDARGGLVHPQATPDLALHFVLLQSAITIALLWYYRAYTWPELVYGLGQYTAAITATALATLATDFATSLVYDWHG